MFNKFIVAVVGSSETGKTTAIEAIIKGLSERGYTVASAKRIHEPEFTIDTKGKDTWRHAKAGASAVLSVAPKELTIIKKVDTKKFTLTQLIAEIPETDILIIEGFKNLVEQDMTVPKIVAIKMAGETSAALERYKNILAFIGHTLDKKEDTKIPFIDIRKEPEKLVELVNSKVAVYVERKQKREEKVTIQVNEKFLPLNDFVQNIIKNTILALVSSLKGVNNEITKDLNTKIKITIKTKNDGETKKTNK